jgi:hypothetical protein
MSSPGARQRRRRQQYQNPRTRAELVTAVGAAVGIVAGTALMIWLLRPGGLADRQPRSSWLIGAALIAAATVCYVILRPSSRLKMSRRVALSGSLGIILVVAVVAGWLWPGGLLRHTPSFASIPTTPTVNPLTSTSAIVPLPSSTAIPGTTAPSGTTAAGGSSTAPAAAPGATGSTTAGSTRTTATPPSVSPSP